MYYITSMVNKIVNEAIAYVIFPLFLFVNAFWICRISENKYFGTTTMFYLKARYMFLYWCKQLLLFCAHFTSHSSLWCTNDTINADILQASPEPELSQSDKIVGCRLQNFAINPYFDFHNLFFIKISTQCVKANICFSQPIVLYTLQLNNW